MMEFKGYLGKIDFDDVLYGEVVNIRDVITFQGQSVGELPQAFEDSIEDYLAFCKERGEEPEKPFSGRFTVQLSPEEHRRIILAATKAGKRVDSWVADILGQAVQA